MIILAIVDLWDQILTSNFIVMSSSFLSSSIDLDVSQFTRQRWESSASVYHVIVHLLSIEWRRFDGNVYSERRKRNDQSLSLPVNVHWGWSSLEIIEYPFPLMIFDWSMRKQKTLTFQSDQSWSGWERKFDAQSNSCQRGVQLNLSHKDRNEFPSPWSFLITSL